MTSNMNKQWVLRKNDMLFYMAFFLYFVTKYTEFTSLQNGFVVSICNMLKNASYVLCFLVIIIEFFERRIYDLKTIIIHGSILLLIAYQVLEYGTKSILVILLFSYAFGTRDFRTFLRIVYCLNILMYTLTVLGVYIGWTKNVVTSEEKMGVIWTRVSLGFNYPGQAMMALIPIVLLYYYLYIEEINIGKNLFWVMVSLVIYSYTQTIMPMLIVILYILVVNIVRKMVMWKYIYLFIPITAIMTFGIWFLFVNDNAIAITIDRISNYRFSLPTYVLEDYDISWWGTGFQNINTSIKYWVIDSEYIFMLVSNGIVYTLMAIFILTAMTKWANRQGDVMLVWALCVYAGNAIFNNGIYNFVMNPFMIVVVRSLGNMTREYVISKKIKLRVRLSFEK